MAQITIHKKTMCSRQKYPKHLSSWYNAEFFTDFKYICCSFIEATFQNLFQLFKIYLVFFFVFFKLSQISSIITQPLEYDVFVFIAMLTGRWGAKVTQNEKEPVFSASTRFLKDNHTTEFQIFCRIWGG